MKLLVTTLNIILSILLLVFLSSCDREVRVHYSECSRLNDMIYNNGKPFTGKVWAQDEGSYLESQAGHQIAIIGLYENGSIAYKMEFYKPDERHISSFSKEGKLLYRQRIDNIGFRKRPDIWDFEGNKLEYDDINKSPSVQPIIEYCVQNVNPIVERAWTAYQNQLSKASY